MLSFNDENASLWAVDTNNMVYYYDLSSHWIKVGEDIKHVSSGRNGVWAVNTDHQPLFRDGVTESNPRGITWRVVTLPTTQCEYFICQINSRISRIVSARLSLVRCLIR